MSDFNTSRLGTETGNTSLKTHIKTTDCVYTVMAWHHSTSPLNIS